MDVASLATMVLVLVFLGTINRLVELASRLAEPIRPANDDETS